MAELTMQIRLARRDDASKIDLLIAQSIRLWKPYYSPAQIESSLVHLFCVDPQLIAQKTHYVAETCDTIVGCCGWSQGATLADGGEPTTTGILHKSNERAEIRALFVHPEWLRRGIGGRLLRTCQSLAESAGFTQISALATLVGAPFYRHHGFTEVEQRALRLPDGELFPVVRMANVVTQAINTESTLCI